LKSRTDTFADRLETANKAKQALLDRAREKDPSKDPEFAARLEARAAAAAQREQRESERQAARLAEREKRVAEREARKAEQAARAAEQAAAEAAVETERINRALRKQTVSLADLKAARDARYAARKARARS
jgi:Family of unknown function (DUF6481)